MKRKFFLLLLITISSCAFAQDFVNPIPKKDIRRLKRIVRRHYRRDKNCDCTISWDSISMISIYWVSYETEGYIDKDSFISLEFAKHLEPWYFQYGWRRLLRNNTSLYDQKGTSLASFNAGNGWGFGCRSYRLKGDNIFDSEKFYKIITEHDIKHLFQIYNLALGELIGVSEKGEVFLISGCWSSGNHFMAAKIQSIPDDYWLELFEKPENPAKRKLLYQIELLDD